MTTLASLVPYWERADGLGYTIDPILCPDCAAPLAAVELVDGLKIYVTFDCRSVGQVPNYTPLWEGIWSWFNPGELSLPPQELAPSIEFHRVDEDYRG